jgi:hypothetical protein
MSELEQRPKSRPAREAEQPLLSDIGRLGGEDRVKGAQGALEVFHQALSQLVKDNPAAYGAGPETESQERTVTQLIDSVRTCYLTQTVTGLRRHAGYVKVLGYWIHRAVFTFLAFGFLAAIVLPLCAVSLMSSSAWGWLPGAIGIAAALGAGGWILSRIRTG